MAEQFDVPWKVQDILSFFRGKEGVFAKARHGLEKESLRVDPQGNLALTPHPKALGDKLTDPYIITDFSESQPEFITPPFEKIEEAIKFLEKLTRFTYRRLEHHELLWPMSMPARLPAEKDIPIARYGDSPEGQEKEIYRRGLALRYGKYMQTICGVHYNFSFDDEFWDVLFNGYGKGMKRQDFINEIYLNMVRNFIRYRWLFVFLFGASPYKDETYRCKLMAKDKGHAVSLRSSRCGYSNPAKLPITYNSFSRHLADLQFAVDTVHTPYTELGLEDHGERVQLNDHILQVGNEYYFSIRLKPPKPYGDMVRALASDGVKYVEVRIFDVNPFEYSGVSARQLYFAHLFLLYCLLMPSRPVDEKVLDVATTNQQDAALYGRSPSLYLKREGKSVLMTEWAGDILSELRLFAGMMDKAFSKPVYGPVLEYFAKEVDDPKDLPAFRIAREMEETHENFLEFGLDLARTYSQRKR